MVYTTDSGIEIGFSLTPLALRIEDHELLTIPYAQTLSELVEQLESKQWGRRQIMMGNILDSEGASSRVSYGTINPQEVEQNFKGTAHKFILTPKKATIGPYVFEAEDFVYMNHHFLGGGVFGWPKKIPETVRDSLRSISNSNTLYGELLRELQKDSRIYAETDKCSYRSYTSFD